MYIDNAKIIVQFSISDELFFQKNFHFTVLNWELRKVNWTDDALISYLMQIFWFCCAKCRLPSKLKDLIEPVVLPKWYCVHPWGGKLSEVQLSCKIQSDYYLNGNRYSFYLTRSEGNFHQIAMTRAQKTWTIYSCCILKFSKVFWSLSFSNDFPPHFSSSLSYNIDCCENLTVITLYAQPQTSVMTKRLLI